MYQSLLEQFQGQPVVDFQDAKSWQGPDFAYRLREEYDDKVSVNDRLQTLLAQPGSERLLGLVIGAWSGAFEGGGSQEIIGKLAEAAPRLPELRALFFGDITVEECEVSWINQSDVSPLLRAFPKLATLRVRGGTGLSFSKVRHASLRELALETGGLSRSTIREVFLCDFPAIEHLELLLGEDNYGFDGSVEDLQPLLSGRLFPSLKFLGLMNSDVANDVAAVLVNSPIADRVEEIDLSLGNLDDEGVKSLLGLASRKNLKKLNISHHYAAQQTVDALAKALPCALVAEDRQEPENDWRPIVHAE